MRHSGGSQWRGTCHILLKRYVLKWISATFADRVASTETLQRHEDLSSLLQRIAVCYKALFADKSSCVSVSVAIMHLENEFKSIHALHKTINTVAMLMRGALLCHFRKGMYHSEIGSCTLLSLMYSCDNTLKP